MMKVLLVDDEPRALERLNKMCLMNKGIEIVGAYDQSKDALAFAKDHAVDLVLLDIEMPTMSGIAFAEQLFEIKPQVDVVFITAYDQYALEAFKVAAVGYLLKPITPEELNQQIEKLAKKRAEKRTHEISEINPNLNSVSLNCMGGFQCVTPKGEVIKWRTAKAEELVAILAHHQFKPILKETILDLLWPQMSYDRASKNLHAICYYIRDTFAEYGYSDVLVRNKGAFKLNPQHVTIDALLLKKLIDRSFSDLSHDEFERVLSLDSGKYFDGKLYEWAQPTEAWFANRLEMLYLIRAKQWLHTDREGDALALLNRVITVNHTCEEAYELLIKVAMEKGDRTTAVRWYQKYARGIRSELDLEPSARMSALIKG